MFGNLRPEGHRWYAAVGWRGHWQLTLIILVELYVSRKVWVSFDQDHLESLPTEKSLELVFGLQSHNQQIRKLHHLNSIDRTLNIMHITHELSVSKRWLIPGL